MLLNAMELQPLELPPIPFSDNEYEEIDEEIINAFEELFPSIESYRMTEELAILFLINTFNL